MKYRVAVVGGGPSGCAAALALSRFPIHSVVFEAGKHNRDKPCGDGLTERTVRALQVCGVDEQSLVALGARKIHQVQIHNVDGQIVRSIKIDGYVTLKRSILDQFLRDICTEVGEVRYSAEVKKISSDSRGLCMEFDDGVSSFKEQFDAVILASGANSVFGRQFGIDGDPVTAIGISTYVERLQADTLEFFEMEHVEDGYGWVFPLNGDIVNLGVGRRVHTKPNALKNAIESLLRIKAIAQPRELRGGRIPLWSGRSRGWHHSVGVVTCGDAAGLADPWSGEGIASAIVSGINAGISVARFVMGGRDPKTLQNYSRQISRQHQHLHSRKKFPIQKGMVEYS